MSKYDDDDDTEMFEISDSKYAPSSPTRRMDLDLSSTFRRAESKDDHVDIQESEVMVIFDLPDGSQTEQNVCIVYVIILQSFFLIRLSNLSNQV
jgi:hypothetical protein